MKRTQLKFNIEVAAIRTEAVGNRQFMVVPTVASASPVMNGVYYPQDVWQWSEPSWNGRPVTIDHPTAGGEHVMANSPDILAAAAIGSLFNVSYADGRLHGEMWLDEQSGAATTNEKSGAIFTNIKGGKMVEVSTGLWLDGVEEQGVINGQEYTYRAVNIWPDHLAVLTEGIGACSINQGCGAPRTNSQEENMPNMQPASNEEVSVNQLWELLRTAVSGEGEVWMLDIFSEGATGYFVYEVEFGTESKTYKRTYSLSPDGMNVESMGDRANVTRKVSYIEVNKGQPRGGRIGQAVTAVVHNLTRKLKGEHMSKQTLLDAGYAPAVVELLSDAQIEQIAGALTPAPAADITPTIVDPAPAGNDQGTVASELTELVDLVREAGGAKALIDTIRQAQTNAAKQRTALIEQVVNSKQSPFTADQLAKLDTEMLSAMANKCQMNQQNSQPLVVDYSGMGVQQPPTDGRVAGTLKAHGLKIKAGGQN